MTTITIARHGNTFDKGDTVLRVGLKSDLPLSTSGQQQAVLLGKLFDEQAVSFDEIITSELQRTIQSAQLITQQMKNSSTLLRQNALFNEIDYGPDEAKTEDVVLKRIGEQALLDWDEKAIVPDGWVVSPKSIIDGWHQFANACLEKYPNGHILVVTSNGVARFAPYLTGDFLDFANNHVIKLKTGSYGQLKYTDNGWHVVCWGQRPN